MPARRGSPSRSTSTSPWSGRATSSPTDPARARSFFESRVCPATTSCTNSPGSARAGLNGRRLSQARQTSLPRSRIEPSLVSSFPPTRPWPGGFQRSAPSRRLPAEDDCLRVPQAARPRSRNALRASYHLVDFSHGASRFLVGELPLERERPVDGNRVWCLHPHPRIWIVIHPAGRLCPGRLAPRGGAAAHRVERAMTLLGILKESRFAHSSPRRLIASGM